MNIFYLDTDPYVAASYLCDKHSIKMALEVAQILCAAFENGEAPYKRTHYNHPSCVWARASRQNYEWLIAHGKGIAQEYGKRYGKTHKSLSVILWCEANMEKLNLPDRGLTTVPLCMPSQYWSDDPVLSYRAYYIGEKSEIAQWNKSDTPKWWPYDLRV